MRLGGLINHNGISMMAQPAISLKTTSSTNKFTPRSKISLLPLLLLATGAKNWVFPTDFDRRPYNSVIHYCATL